MLFRKAEALGRRVSLAPWTSHTAGRAVARGGGPQEAKPGSPPKAAPAHSNRTSSPSFRYIGGSQLGVIWPPRGHCSVRRYFGLS